VRRGTEGRSVREYKAKEKLIPKQCGRRERVFETTHSNTKEWLLSLSWICFPVMVWQWTIESCRSTKLKIIRIIET
jgi:hypothetical protein